MGYLVYAACESSVNRVIMSNTHVVLFTYCLLLKGSVIMFKSLVILSSKHENLSRQHVIKTMLGQNNTLV